MLLLKFFKFYSCHNFKGCSLCNFTRCKITIQLQPPKGVLQLMLTMIFPIIVNIPFTA